MNNDEEEEEEEEEEEAHRAAALPTSFTSTQRTATRLTRGTGFKKPIIEPIARSGTPSSCARAPNGTARLSDHCAVYARAPALAAARRGGW
jgi:hypothetical protein